tara:strand:+ start:352 stop:852 length:501 start_codon:yes stop_codon:yes gene_type:complete
MATELLRDVTAFNQDPLGVSDELVARIKEALRERHDIPTTVQLRIGANERLTSISIVFPNGDFFIDDLSVVAKLPQQDPFFSTDPDFLAKDLRCDGRCNCTFQLEDDVHTNGSEDFCASCFDRCEPSRRDKFTRVTVRERCSQYAHAQVSALNGILGTEFKYLSNP